jgi:hypothetical protein
MFVLARALTETRSNRVPYDVGDDALEVFLRANDVFEESLLP